MLELRFQGKLISYWKTRKIGIFVRRGNHFSEAITTKFVPFEKEDKSIITTYPEKYEDEDGLRKATEENWDSEKVKEVSKFLKKV